MITTDISIRRIYPKYFSSQKCKYFSCRKRCFLKDKISLLILLKLDFAIDGVTIWFNPFPSSTSFCRPIRLQFVKVTADVSREEKKYFDEKILKLKPYKLKLSLGPQSFNLDVNFDEINHD